MRQRRTSYFKLGLFVTVTTLVALASAIALGARAAMPATVSYHTYFNESVQGLDVGAPVKYRGVNIGVVDKINIAEDKRHVDVAMEFELDDLAQLGLTKNGKAGEPMGLAMESELRAQLGSQGITGVKFVNIDFFDPRTNPPPVLPFEPPPNYIPAASSLFKNLEDTVVRAAEKFPEIADNLASISARIDKVLGVLDEKHVPENIATVIENLNAIINDVQAIVKSTERQALPDKAGKAIANLDEALTKLNRVIGSLEGEKGFVSRAGRAADAFGDVGKSATGTARQLEDTMKDLSDAARAIRDLAEAVERDPDMLVKGRERKHK
ncbi:MAG: MCE family protein [Polyangiaceae bacterium]|nr:MCE family protein [Polyangiaceae bacterium]